jgi:hypothetical protein
MDALSVMGLGILSTHKLQGHVSSALITVSNVILPFAITVKKGTSSHQIKQLALKEEVFFAINLKAKGIPSVRSILMGVLQILISNMILVLVFKFQPLSACLNHSPPQANSFMILSPAPPI